MVDNKILIEESHSITMNKSWIQFHSKNNYLVIDKGAKLTNCKIKFMGNDSIVHIIGARIGSGSVLATNAVITGDVYSNTIYGGLPAKLIKAGIHWDRQSFHSFTEEKSAEFGSTKEDNLSHVYKECIEPLNINIEDNINDILNKIKKSAPFVLLIVEPVRKKEIFLVDFSVNSLFNRYKL